jgi:hypothetical protein
MLVADFAWEKNIDDWYRYPFNFTGEPGILVGEITKLHDVLLETFLASNGHMGYLWKDDVKSTAGPRSPITHIAGHGLILKISSTNSGHALSEMMSFLEYYFECKEQFDWIVVRSDFHEKNKFIFSLLCQFIPRAKIKLIKNKTIYSFEAITLRRNRWFNAVKDWRSIRYTKSDNLVHLQQLNFILENLQDSPRFVMEFSKKLHAEASYKYNLRDKVLMLKMEKNPLQDPGNRAMHVPVSSRNIATENGFSIFYIDNIADIEEYICTLQHAKVAVFSYGATACTNRFFLNENCLVILLANESYKAEYEFGPELWHPLHSHTFPVNRQIIWLDFPDVVTDADVIRLMQLVDTTLLAADN